MEDVLKLRISTVVNARMVIVVDNAHCYQSKRYCVVISDGLSERNYATIFCTLGQPFMFFKHKASYEIMNFQWVPESRQIIVNEKTKVIFVTYKGCIGRVYAPPKKW
jgi:hypothetical protein